MQIVLFYVDESCFGIETKFVKRIIPYVNLKTENAKNKYFLGSLLLGDEIIPVFDFSYLIKEKEAKRNLNTRIIILENFDEFVKENNKLLFGIVGEQVGSIYDMNDAEKKNIFNNLKLPFLNEVYNHEKGIINKIIVPELFKFLMKSSD